MPAEKFILVILVGLVLGVVASVVLKSRGLVFFVNIVLGVLGACIGAFAPVMITNELTLDLSTMAYLLRAIMSAFILLLIASLFRPVNTRGR